MIRSKIVGWTLVAALLLAVSAGFAWPRLFTAEPAPEAAAPGSQLAVVEPALDFTNALWVATSGDLLKLALADGSLLARQPELADTVAVAVDEEESRAWVFDLGETLTALSFAGEPLASAPFPGHLDETAVELAAGGGFAWLGFKDVVFQVDAAGNLVDTFPVTRGLRALAFDPTGPALWMANLREVSSFDLAGQPLASLDLGNRAQIVGLAVDRSSGDLWLAQRDGVRLYTGALTLRFDVPLEQVRAVSTDGRGGAWVALHRELVRLDADGVIRARVPLPVGDGSANLLTVAADPAGGVAWALSSDFLFQVSAQGGILRTLPVKNFGADFEGRDLAVYADLFAPLISFTAPADGALLSERRPTLAFAWSDRGIGVDPDSLVVEANGTPVAVTCDATESGASCVPDQPLPEGTLVLAATVADFAGNRSQPARITVTVATALELRPIGNQTVVVGSSLELLLEAVGGVGSRLFSAAPLPLPEGARLDGMTGTFSFSPRVAGQHTLTFSVTDGVTADAETIIITAQAPPAGTPTSVAGRVLDTNDGVHGVVTPIVGARVSLLGQAAVAFTDSQGFFTLSNIAGGEQVIDFDTRPATPAPDGTLYAGFREGIVLLAGTANVISRPFFLPRIDPGSLTTVNPAVTTEVHNQNLGVTVTVPPNTAKNPDGSNFTGQLSVSEVAAALAPVALPEELAPGLLLTVQPVGVTFSQPVAVSAPNQDGMPPGSEVDLWSVNPLTGQFSKVGVGRVRADGTMIETVSGGISAASWHAFMPPQPGSDGSDNNGDNQDMDRCDDCSSGSQTALMNGNLSITHDLPAYFSLNRPRSLRLAYSSHAADPRPVLSSRTTISQRAAVPPAVSVSAEVGGLALGMQVSTNTAGLNENADETILQAVQVDGSALATGSYPYRLKLTSHYGASAISTFQTGQLLVNNLRDSPLGAGWGLAGLERLVEQRDGTVVIADGDGSVQRFRPSSFSIGFPDFADLSGFALNGVTRNLGNPVLAGSARVLRLTNNFGQSGSAFLGAPIVIAADGAPVSFSSQFRFRISNSRGGGADGLTFIVANSPNSLGGGGGGIGYSGLSPSLAVEFDTWNNGGIDGNSDNHVGIGLNGNLASVVRFVPPTLLEDGAVKHVWIDYDGPSRVLEVRLADVPVRPASPQLTHTVDLPLLLGRSDAFFGFTSGTGAAAADHDILGWTFSSDSGSSAYLSPVGDFSELERAPGGGFVRTYKDGSQHRFDAAGRLVEAMDTTGDSTVYSYDAAGRLTAVTDPVGLRTVLAYGGAFLASVTDPAGRVTRFDHDAAGNLVRITDADGTFREFSYDASHRLTRQRSKRGFEAQYSYNFAGQNERVLRPDGSVRTITPKASVGLFAAGTSSAPVVRPSQAMARYVDGRGNATLHDTDRFGSSVRTVDAASQVTTAVRDQHGNPTRIVNSNGSSQDFTYDGRGNLLSLRQTPSGGGSSQELRFTYEPARNRVSRIQDPAGNVLSIDYDAAGNPIRFTDPLGGITTRTFDSHGQVLTSTDANGHVTRFTYDSFGNTETITDARGVVTRFTRDGVGRVVVLTEAAGLPEERRRTYTHDALNRTVQATDPAGAALRYAYDAAGNPIEVTTPTGQVVRTQFDILNRPVRVEDPVRGTTQYTFDANGNPVEVVDAGGARTQIVYDGKNRPIRTVDALGGEQLFTYSPRGQLLAYRNALGQSWTFTYDALDRLIRQADPLGNANTFTYDQRNFLATATNAKGQPETYVYDALGRVVELRAADNTIRRSFDRAGNLTSVEDNDSRLVMAHDELNRPSRIEVVDVGAQPAVVLTPTFDAVGNRTRLADSLGGTTTYSYDPNGRMTRLTTPAGGAIDLTYDAASRLTAIALPNGLTQDYDYDAAGRLSALQYRDGGGALASFGYFYDALGKLITIAEGSKLREFSYDALQRLLTGGTAGLPETYQYDAVGNRVQSFLSSTHRYDAANRLLEDQQFLYAYDVLGNLVARTEKATGQRTDYTYDALNQLVRVDRPDGTAVTYRYDGLGRRIEKNVGGTVTRYVYDGSAILLEFDGSNTLSARYSHGPGVDQPLSMERGGNSYFYLADHQGSIRYLTDAAGAQVNLYEYDSFGRLLVRDETVPNPFAFTGREYDAETGLYFYRARYYDPNLGRFLSEDSLGLTGGDANFYGYVGNDPLNRTDPNGRLFWDIVDVVFFAWSLHDFIECPSLETGLNLLLDTVSLLPGLPSVGWASRADDVLDIVNHGDDLADGVRALDNASDAARGLDNADDAWDAARRPYWDEGAQRWRDPETGQFTRTPWPPNGGFDGPPRSEVLQPGTRIDRYGPESGSYTSPEGTPFDQRSLPAHYENTQPYNGYEVVRPIDVQAGPAAPWFGQPGGGTQYQLPGSVGDLIAGGYLRRIP